jgi:RecB family endonuclease NucS
LFDNINLEAWNLKSEILLREVSLEKAKRDFGIWMVKQMGEYSLHLFLILNPDVIEQGVKPIGLEVNLAKGIETLKTTLEQPRIDLIFYKKESKTYYLVEAKAQKPTSKDIATMKDYIDRFKQNFLPQELKEFHVISMMVYPEEQGFLAGA